ncbi:MAG: hypothetical protein KGH62_01490 [Candidatus Micrarchaeota archaeon]|nr:hypothetical protein [Candidatus Micrarchaeota archaeon]
MENQISDKQKNFLAKLGVPAAEVAKMDAKQAHDRIDAELAKKNGGSPGSANPYTPAEPVKIATLEELLDTSDKVRQHILDHKEYEALTEIGQMRTWEVILNNFIKGKITEGISKNSRRR